MLTVEAASPEQPDMFLPFSGMTLCMLFPARADPRPPPPPPPTKQCTHLPLSPGLADSSCHSTLHHTCLNACFMQLPHVEAPIPAGLVRVQKHQKWW